MYFKQKIGKFGENISYNYLIKNGYKILDRNFSCKQGEIDIIAFSKQKELVFIEVKTRSNLKYGTPSESVTLYKKNHIISSSKYYIYLNNFFDTNIRYDVIEVYLYNSTYKINHIKNAF